MQQVGRVDNIKGLVIKPQFLCPALDAGHLNPVPPGHAPGHLEHARRNVDRGNPCAARGEVNGGLAGSAPEIQSPQT